MPFVPLDSRRPQFIREQTDIVYAIVFANVDQVVLLILYSYQISRGEWAYLLERPLVLIMLGLLGASLSPPPPPCVSTWSDWYQKKQPCRDDALENWTMERNMEKNNKLVFQQTLSEADIDWLFCVELNCCEDFRNWVGPQIFPGIDAFKHVQAVRSVSDQDGESDLVWIVDSPVQGRLMGLIENKISAPAQTNQYKRYVARADRYLEQGCAENYQVVLLAPEKYTSTESDAYPIKITYESVVRWLASRTDERSVYLKSLYEKAINKTKALPTQDLEIVAWRYQVWELGRAEFPSLNIKDPSSEKGTDYWVFICFPEYTIIYKTRKRQGKYIRSMVDLQLSGRGDEVEQLRDEYAKALEAASKEISLVKTDKSASFRLDVPPSGLPRFDKERVREALEAAIYLRDWWDKAQNR